MWPPTAGSVQSLRSKPVVSSYRNSTIHNWSQETLIGKTPGFLERATGLNLKEQSEFRRIIVQCCKKKFDLILTKSIRHFGRNTLDMLHSLRDLSGLGVEVILSRRICG